MPKASPSKTGGPLPFSTLFSSSVAFVRAHGRTILLITVVAAIFPILQYLLNATLPETAPDPVTGRGGGEPDLSNASTAVVVLYVMFGLGSFVSALCAGMMFWILATEGKDDMPTLFRRGAAFILPLIGIQIWSFLRSYAWIAIIGMMVLAYGVSTDIIALSAVGFLLLIAGGIAALVYTPRFMPAPVIYLTEKKGIKESVESSYKRTEGYWGKLVGNSLLFGICMWLVALGALLILGLLGYALDASSSTVTQWIGIVLASVVIAMGQFIMTAFSTVFSVQLAKTVLGKPKTA